MNKVIAVVACCGAVFCAYKSGAISFGGSGYRIEYTGTSGTQIAGSYAVLDMSGKSPMQMEKVSATLPHSVTINPPSGSIVSAAAMPMGQGDVQIKIFKGGFECGQPAMVGSGAMANMVCQP
jgi:hypothetical protein